MPKEPDSSEEWPPPERGVAHLRVAEIADEDIEPLGQIVPPPVVVEHPSEDD